MSTRHVFVETNWVVDLAAPALSRNPGASGLLERSRRGELVLHAPAIALSEAHKVIRERKWRDNVENIRAFIHAMRDSDAFDEPTANTAFEVLSKFEQYAWKERAEAPKRIASLLHDSAVDVIPIDNESLLRATQIAAETELALESFDLAILATILVRGGALHAEGNEIAFCTLDADLQPWRKDGKRKQELADLFDAAGCGSMATSP